MSGAMRVVPLGHPMRTAWDAYRDMAEYENSRTLALHKDADEREHVDGSLWSAFVKGWEAALITKG